MNGYVIRECLGVGQHSATYVATDMRRNHLVVLKLLDWPDDENILNTMIQQCQRQQRFSCFGLALTLEVFLIGPTCSVPQDLPFRSCSAVTSEYGEGGNLDDWMKNHPRVDPAYTIRTFKILADGLAEIHRQGSLHGNIKGTNVIFKGSIPKLCDKIMVRDDGLQIFCVSPYSAPEVRQEQGASYTVLSDFYSLGMLLVQLYTDATAFQAWMYVDPPAQFPTFLPDTPDSPSHIQLPPTMNVVDSLRNLMVNLLRYCPEKRLTGDAMHAVLNGILEKPHLLRACMPPVEDPPSKRVLQF